MTKKKKYTHLDIKTPTGRALYAVFKKLDGGRAWCKNAWAKNSVGVGVVPWNDGAVRFCVNGALNVTLNANTSLYHSVSAALTYTIPPKVIGRIHYNDNPRTTWQTIRKWFGRAIKRAEGWS